MAFRGDSTDTYTYVSGSTGGTVDLGARNTYRYINASNVYNKGKADGYTTHTGTYSLNMLTDSGTTKDMGVSHTYRYISISRLVFSEITGLMNLDGSPYFSAYIPQYLIRSDDSYNTYYWALTTTSASDKFLYMNFSSAVSVYKIRWHQTPADQNGRLIQFDLQYSDNKSNWTYAGTYYLTNSDAWEDADVLLKISGNQLEVSYNYGKHKYWRMTNMYGPNSSAGNGFVGGARIKVYGTT